jgi:hypothetical protein
MTRASELPDANATMSRITELKMVVRYVPLGSIPGLSATITPPKGFMMGREETVRTQRDIT